MQMCLDELIYVLAVGHCLLYFQCPDNLNASRLLCQFDDGSRRCDQGCKESCLISCGYRYKSGHLSTVALISREIYQGTYGSFWRYATGVD